jgi:hypothetical protein
MCTSRVIGVSLSNSGSAREREFKAPTLQHHGQHMTAQVPDWLRYQGQRLELHSTPLEPYFDDDHPRPDFCEVGSMNWRCYAAEWEIDDDTLYLINIDAFVHMHPEAVKGLDGVLHTFNARPFELQDLFPSANGRVKATWFTGELRVSRGELLEDLFDVAYGGIYEEDLLLSFEEGKLVRTEIKDNRHLIPEIQKRQRLPRRTPGQVSGDLLGRRNATSASTQECPFCHKRLSIDYEPGAKLSCSDCGASLTIDPSRKAVGRPEGDEV